MAKKDKKQDALSPEQIQEGTQQSDKAPAVQTSPVGQPVAQTTTSNSSTTAVTPAATPSATTNTGTTTGQTVPAENKVDDSLAARIATAKAGVQGKRDAASAEREAADEKAREALLSAQKREADALRTYNQETWNNLGEITSKIETMQKEAKANDETARRRENAMRYISGLGDTLSSLANLVSTAHGASNQNQTYNSHAVVQKAEEARKARKLEIDDLSKRLDEMMARQRELKATGNLKEAEIAARQAKELAAQEAAARKAAIEEGRYYDALEKSAVTEVTSAYNREQDIAHRDKVFTENVRQFNENQARLNKRSYGGGRGGNQPKEDKDNAAIFKYVSDPKNQKKVVAANIRTIRDGFAQEMGYKDYNEYLQYKEVSGWGEEIPGQRDKVSKRIREERKQAHPDADKWLDALKYYDMLSDEQLAELAEISPVYSNALEVAGRRSIGNPSGEDNPAPEKKKTIKGW